MREKTRKQLTVIKFCLKHVYFIVSLEQPLSFFFVSVPGEKQMSFDDGAFNVYWSYDSLMDLLKFKLVVKATGWISFGFAKMALSQMVDYDVAIGGVLDGQGYLKV